MIPAPESLQQSRLARGAHGSFLFESKVWRCVSTDEQSAINAQCATLVNLRSLSSAPVSNASMLRRKRWWTEERVLNEVLCRVSDPDVCQYGGFTFLLRPNRQAGLDDVGYLRAPAHRISTAGGGSHPAGRPLQRRRSQFIMTLAERTVPSGKIGLGGRVGRMKEKGQDSSARKWQTRPINQLS